MADIAAVSGVLSSIKIATDIAKLIRESYSSLEEADQKFKLAELVDSLADAKLQVAEIKEEIIEKGSIIRQLKQELEDANDFEEKLSNLVFESPFYVNNDTEELFCSRCIEGDKKAIHLTKTGSLEMRKRVWACPECKNTFSDIRVK